METTSTTPAKLLDLAYKATGAEITLTPEAIKQKENAIAALVQIIEITTPEQQAVAVNLIAIAAGLEKKMEATRKEVKAPVLVLGSTIDETAKTYVTPIAAAKDRVNTLLNDFNRKERGRKEQLEKAHRDEQSRLQKEIEDKRLADEAAAQAEEKRRQAEIDRVNAESKAELERLQREQANEKPEPDEDPALVAMREAATKAEYDQLEKGRMDRVQALQNLAEAERAEKERLRIIAESKASVVTAPMVHPPVAKPKGMSVKKVPKYEVTDIMAVLKAHPELCKVELRADETIKAIRAGLTECGGMTITWVDETNVRAV